MLHLTKEIPLPVLSGKGFILRPYQDSDVVSLQKNINNQEVARDVSHIPFPYTLEDAGKWVSQAESVVRPDSVRVDYVIDVDGEVAGSVAFINIDQHKAQVSVWVGPHYWRRGLALESLKLLIRFGFGTLGLVRISAYHYSENQKTAGLLEKAGFKFEGVHEREWLKVIDGKVKLFDSNYYSIINSSVSIKKVSIVEAGGEGYTLARQTASQLSEIFTQAGLIVYDDGEVQGDEDLAISIGGDGTMMKTVSMFSKQGIPVLGVNAGNVGFLTSAEAKDVLVVASRILNSDFVIERRLALKFKWKGETYGPFANEVLLRHPSEGIATFAVAIDDEVLFERLEGDGVLVAAATGSTAYNASAGGPIITPESSNVVINALNPPMFNMRPVVTEKLLAGGTIEIKVIASKRDEPLRISADSMRIKEGPRVGDSVFISRHPQPLLFATFGHDQYVEALKGKMNLAR